MKNKSFLHLSDSEAFNKLQKENTRLNHLLEKSEKAISKRVKESKREIEKITNVVNKFWKLLNKQIE